MIIRFIKNFKNKQNKNRRLIDLCKDQTISTADRGWITQELNMISVFLKNNSGKQKRNIRNPPGKDLAHEYGRENAKGYGYEHANFKLKKDHIYQHKFDNGGKKNKERAWEIIKLL